MDIDEKPDFDALSSADDFVTPKKIKLDHRLTTILEHGTGLPKIKLDNLINVKAKVDLSGYTPTERTAPTTKAIHVIWADWETVQANFQLLLLELQDQANDKSELKRALAKTLKHLTDHLSQVGHKTSLISASLGMLWWTQT
jgi:hypothetical protein